MSINSLANFGVPGQGGERSALLQPIIAHRFRAVFYNFGDPGERAPYDMTRNIRSVNRPQMEFDVQTLYTYHTTVYIPTRGEWQAMNIRLFDDIDNSVMRRVQQQQAKQQNFYDQTSYRAGENVKFDMDLDVLGGGASAGQNASDPNIIQKYCYVGCFVSSFDHGEMSYENNTPMEIALTIRYDNVTVFDQDGVRMGDYDHGTEIDGRQGISVTSGGPGTTAPLT